MSIRMFQVMFEFEKKTGMTCTAAWPVCRNCWRVRASDGMVYEVRIKKGGK